MKDSLGDVIRDRRVGRGWDQPALAKRLEVTQQTLSRWENNAAKPRPAKLARLAVALELDLKALQTASLAGKNSAASSVEVRARVPALLPNLPLELLNQDEFEEFTVALLQELHPFADLYRNGKSGHKQYGIDVFINHSDGQPRGGVQCKRVAQFGPAHVRKAVEAFDGSTRVVQPQIFLSRSASPASRREVENHPGWTIFDRDDLSRMLRQLPIDSQLRIVREFFPALRPAFLGIAEPTPWLTAEDFRAPLDRTDGFFGQGWELVGRSEELATLIEFARSDGQPVHVVEAPAGAGKTRLLLGLADALEEDVAVGVRFLDPGTDVAPADFELLPETPKLVLVIEDAHGRTDLSGLVRGTLKQRPHARILLVARAHSVSGLKAQLRLVDVTLDCENVSDLGHLSFSEARELAMQVVSSQHRHELILDALAHLGTDSVFFVVVAGQLLNKGRITTRTLEGSPELRAKILDAFREAMIGADGPAGELRTELVAAVATMQPFRSDQQNFQNSIEQLIERKYRLLTPVLAQLEEAGVLIRKGATYRVFPDLLGDIVLSNALVNQATGHVTSYSRELIDALEDDVLEHALVNVSRVDAQIQQAAYAGGSIMDALWAPLRESFPSADIARRLKLTAILKKVAYHQPKRALEAVEWILANPFIGPVQQSVFEGLLDAPRSTNHAVRNAMVSVLERVARSADQLPRAMTILRELVQEPVPPAGRHGDPATTALRDLMDFSAPIEYLTLVEATVFDWAAEPNLSDSEHILVMQILEPALVTEFKTNRSEGLTLRMGSRLVSAAAVHQLRRPVIDLALSELQSGVPKRSAKASELLEAAFRYPSGLLGQEITDAETEQWNPDHSETLASLRSILHDNPTLPVVAAARKALGGLATYRTGDFSDEVRVVWNELPTDLESNVSLALRGGSPGIEPDDLEEILKERTAWQISIADELVANTSSAAILEMVSDAIATHQELALTDDPKNFLSAVFDRDTRMASLLVERVLLDPVGSLAAVVGMALQVEFDRDPGQIGELVEKVLAVNSLPLRRTLAQALAWSMRGKLTATPEALNWIESFLVDEDDVVVQHALIAIWVVAEFDVPAVSRLVDVVDFARSKVIASNVASEFGQRGRLQWGLASKATRTSIMDGLIALPDIEDYALGQLVSAIAAENHESAIGLMMRRIEAEESAPPGIRYRALPFHLVPHLLAPDELSRDRALVGIWNWMCDEPNSWHRIRGGTGLFWLVGSSTDPGVLALLEARASGTSCDFTILSSVLENLPRTFVLENSDFVIRMFDAAAVVGEEAIKRVRSGFYGSLVLGGRSRSIGIADPEDVAARDRFIALAAISSGPAGEFFIDMSRDLEREIERNAEEDASLVDRHDW